MGGKKGKKERGREEVWSVVEEEGHLISALFTASAVYPFGFFPLSFAT